MIDVLILARPSPARGAVLRGVRQILGHKLLLTGLVLCLAVVAMALLADSIQVQAPERLRVRDAFVAPGPTHPFGTDNLGRDVYSRVVHGARFSLLIGLATVALTALAGTLLGCVSGYFRRWDEPVMRAMDALMSFPAILLAVAITAALGPSAVNAVIALAAVYTPRTARIVRASILVVREMEYVQAVRSVGAGQARTLVRHVLPNCLSPLVIQLTFVFAYAVLAEAALSFLGMGPPPPTPTWGNIIAEGRDYLREAPWICLFPGAAISLTVLGFNLLGDGLRDVLDPRMKVQAD
ncbi:MAG: ABC transporter permease [Candidatus Rokubacteria bacterium]|nr:ABC transporter permease [Candidatus Rokubacteria bacterium]